MNGLDLLRGRHSQTLTLRTLFSAEEAITGREVERRTGLSNRAVMLALEHLFDVSAVHREEQGKSFLFSLNHNNYFVKILKQGFEAEDLFWTDFSKTVKRNVNPKPIAAIATGPLARDETALDGKIELTMLFPSGRNRIRAFKTMEHLSEVLWATYTVTIEPILLDVNNMNMDSYAHLWKRIEREGILLFGKLP